MSSTGEPFGLFWDSDNGDRTYSAGSFESWLKKFFTSGVFEGDMQVTATSGMTLQVGAGYTNVDGKVKFWNAPFTLTLNPANSTYPRIDTVVITRDNVNREILCEVVTGQYSGDTPQPTAPVRNAETYQLVLAQIYVGNGVTEVTQSNITDTRTDTELCGYIAGTVTEMDFSQFTIQFERYFAEFKREHETEWSTWETAQQAAYTAWFALVQAQQVQDKADWDAWYAALQDELHNLPSDTAEYLQIEIDEIREMGTTGSIFKISTENSELEGKTVTVTSGTEVRTATFDENLECTVSGFKSVGVVSFTSTDGIQTATNTLEIEYFSNYAVPLNFWSATVNIDGGETLSGYSVTVKDSNNTTVGTVTLNALGRGSFTAEYADTYSFIVTYDGETYITELVVDEETTYSLSIEVGFVWSKWVTFGGLDPADYTDLDDVFSDEAAVRRLMLVHASADYLVECVADDVDTIDDFVANDTAMKWIGLCDYVCDNLTAINGVEAKFLASEYWERYLKDHVPIMTSNTAPYGTASASSIIASVNDAFNAFNQGATGRAWSSASNVPTAYIQYKFVSPVCIKMVTAGFEAATVEGDFTLSASNDGTNFVPIQSGVKSGVATPITTSINNDDYYLYYRMTSTKANYTPENRVCLAVLQFYGRALNVSVPVMTSNTAPYGEASASSEYSSSYTAYKAFIENITTGVTNRWSASAGSLNGWLQYKFTSRTCVKQFVITPTRNVNDEYLTKSITLCASNDGTDFSTVLYTETFTGNDKKFLTKTVDVNNDNFYLYYRLVYEGEGATIGLNYLQFYGVDYSEKEFEVGTTKKWLYDHGVELETLSDRNGGSGGIAPIHGSDSITLQSGGSGTYSQIYKTMNLTEYALMRGKFEFYMSSNQRLAVQDTTFSTNLGRAEVSVNGPNNSNLDISSINQTANAMVASDASANGKLVLLEWWLE